LRIREFTGKTHQEFLEFRGDKFPLPPEVSAKLSAWLCWKGVVNDDGSPFFPNLEAAMDLHFDVKETIGLEVMVLSGIARKEATKTLPNPTPTSTTNLPSNSEPLPETLPVGDQPK
jgi:hypothetical protein